MRSSTRARGRGPADRPGLAVAVCALPRLGFVPDDVASAPPGTGGPDTPATDIRIGYARCSHLTQELQSQLDALEARGIPRDKIFFEKVSTRVRVRPKFEAAPETCRQIKAHDPHCRVILTVYEMKRLGRDSAELTALADHLTAHGIALEMPAGLSSCMTVSVR